MGRVVGDGAYFTIYDVVVHKDFQGLGLGSIIINEIVQWYKTIQDDDTFLYVNASKNKEHFYEKFGFYETGYIKNGFKYADDIKKYTASKNEFISNILSRAYKMYNLDQLHRFKT